MEPVLDTPPELDPPLLLLLLPCEPPVSVGAAYAAVGAATTAPISAIVASAFRATVFRARVFRAGVAGI
ncbi:hypothetical protein GCM10010361_04190 [Streptomyces olivaceiscleroticus]|uniref:Uncharacterized protein n=1 Tax=Streptomyces olivaceiscleroticus TaxID=68245 RepID=A0ABN0ZCL7_9ACTN